MLEQEKRMLCDCYDQLTKEQRKYILVTISRCAAKNQAKRPRLHLVSSAAQSSQPRHVPTPIGFPDIRAASS